jgi:hypothetical protein
MSNEKPKEEKPKVDVASMEAIKAIKDQQVKTNSTVKK